MIEEFNGPTRQPLTVSIVSMPRYPVATLYTLANLMSGNMNVLSPVETELLMNAESVGPELLGRLASLHGMDRFQYAAYVVQSVGAFLLSGGFPEVLKATQFTFLVDNAPTWLMLMLAPGFPKVEHPERFYSEGRWTLPDTLIDGREIETLMGAMSPEKIAGDTFRLIEAAIQMLVEARVPVVEASTLLPLAATAPFVWTVSLWDLRNSRHYERLSTGLVAAVRRELASVHPVLERLFEPSFAL